MARGPDLMTVKKKKKNEKIEKRTCRIMDFPVLADIKVKLKES